ncbi:MAG: hypothetical protein KDE53_37400, partial [Caldilineaceae bacterium]|nr:hypothetical protein [Caldilineaceae bacterium]
PTWCRPSAFDRCAGAKRHLWQLWCSGLSGVWGCAQHQLAPKAPREFFRRARRNGDHQYH